MCRDEGMIFFLSPAERFLLLGNDKPLSPLAMDREADITVGVGVDFAVFGVEICGDLLGKGDAGFFMVPAKFLSFPVAFI